MVTEIQLVDLELDMCPYLPKVSTLPGFIEIALRGVHLLFARFGPVSAF